MTAPSTFDVIFVGAEPNARIAARYLAHDGGAVCQLFISSRDVVHDSGPARPEAQSMHREDASRAYRAAIPRQR
jgi:ribulose 1,5-bisphosphate synthetase/thiazole synthase